MSEERKAVLSRTDNGYIYIAPRFPTSGNYTHGCEVTEGFVLKHLHSMPSRPVRFSNRDQSYVELLYKLDERPEA
jgi:hypothetical protein